jgi:hypothetical protein
VKVLDITSPHMKGQLVRDAQFLLQGDNRYSKTDHPVHPYKGKVDGVYGEATAHAADRARYVLGYPNNKIAGGHFGAELRSYLLPKTSKDAKPLPKAYNIRRYARLKLEARKAKQAAKANTPKKLALAAALSQVGYHESGTNWTKFGAWYGFNGVAWCAIFVSWCLNEAGKHVKTALAFQWEYWGRAGANGLSITYNPEPGDIVVYHNGEGHTGLFYRWTDRAQGRFQAVEGNEYDKVMIQDRNIHSLKTVFVKVS